MKPLSETYKELGIAFSFPIEINDDNGNETYFETARLVGNADGYWERCERDAKGRETYFENSTGYWYKYERDAKGNGTYYENSEGLKRGTPKSSKTCEGKVIEVDGIKYKLIAQ
jgi:hypothetical protein